MGRRDRRVARNDLLLTAQRLSRDPVVDEPDGPRQRRQAVVLSVTQAILDGFHRGLERLDRRRDPCTEGLELQSLLGGLGDVRSDLSTHLRSRTEVAERLQDGPVPVTILRAAIIVGSGSASYEILSNLVARFPVIFTPREVGSLCQPIAIRDVVKYLVGSLESEETAGNSFDIGGDDVMSYREMMRTVAQVLNRRRLFITMPVISLKAFGYVAGLLTPVPGPITMSLMEGMKNDVVCEDSWIRRILPFETLPYRESLVRAMTREDQDRVHTRWSDAYPPAHELELDSGE